MRPNHRIGIHHGRIGGIRRNAWNFYDNPVNKHNRWYSQIFNRNRKIAEALHIPYVRLDRYQNVVMQQTTKISSWSSFHEKIRYLHSLDEVENQKKM